MVAPSDLGKVAAQRLLSGVDDVDVRYIEGPKRYSPENLAEAFANALGRPVELAIIPRKDWKQSFLELGFSDRAAESYTRMTELSIDKGFDMPDDSWRGQTSLETYIRSRVEVL